MLIETNVEIVLPLMVFMPLVVAIPRHHPVTLVPAYWLVRFIIVLFEMLFEPAALHVIPDTCTPVALVLAALIMLFALVRLPIRLPPIVTDDPDVTWMPTMFDETVAALVLAVNPPIRLLEKFCTPVALELIPTVRPPEPDVLVVICPFDVVLPIVFGVTLPTLFDALVPIQLIPHQIPFVVEVVLVVVKLKFVMVLP